MIQDLPGRGWCRPGNNRLLPPQDVKEAQTELAAELLGAPSRGWNHHYLGVGEAMHRRCCPDSGEGLYFECPHLQTCTSVATCGISNVIWQGIGGGGD